MRPRVRILLLFLLAGIAVRPPPSRAQQPPDSVVAVVLGEEILRGRTPETDGRRLMGVILQRLLERYAEENDIEPTEEEIDSFIDAMQLPPGAEDLDIPPEVRRESARRFVRAFQINRSLYEKYGGRVIFQQGGPEPVDAYRRFLEERREAGDFRILDPSLVDGFWEYLTDDDMHSFYPADEAERIMTRPWWLEPHPDSK